MTVCSNEHEKGCWFTLFIRKLQRVVFLLLPVFFLCGCVKVQITLDVSHEAEVTGTIRALYSSIMMTQDGSDVMDVLGDMKDQFQEQFPQAQITIIKPGEVLDYYAGLSIGGIPLDSEVDVKKEGHSISLKIPVDQLSNRILQMYGEDGEEIPGPEILKSYGFESVLVVNMPGPATSNVGSVEKNTVTIDLLDIPADVEEITVSCSTISVPALTAAGAAVLVIAGLMIFHAGKHRS